MPSELQKKQILIDNAPTVEHFMVAKELFSQVDESVTKIKRCTILPFSAIRVENEIFLLSQGYFYERTYHTLPELLALLGGGGSIYVRIAFKLLPNGRIKPMIVKIIAQLQDTKDKYRQKIQQEMDFNRLFEMTPYTLVMERESSFLKNKYPQTSSELHRLVKSYLILENGGPDLIELFNKPFVATSSPLAILDIAYQCLNKAYSYYNIRYVHRDLKLDNYVAKPIENSHEYQEVFYNIQIIDPADAQAFSDETRQLFLGSTFHSCAGTQDYLPPFQRDFIFTPNLRWNLTILHPSLSFEEEKKHLLSGFVLQAKISSTEKSFNLFITNKNNESGWQQLSLNQEKCQKFIKKYEDIFNKSYFNADSKIDTYPLNKEDILELFQLTENFLPRSSTEAPDFILVYNLETELYGAAKAAHEIIKICAYKLRQSSSPDSTLEKLAGIINTTIMRILSHKTFSPYNPYPQFSDSTHSKIKSSLEYVQSEVNLLKEARRKNKAEEGEEERPTKISRTTNTT